MQDLFRGRRILDRGDDRRLDAVDLVAGRPGQRGVLRARRLDEQRVPPAPEQQSVEQQAERIDIRSGVDIEQASGLFGTHALERPQHLSPMRVLCDLGDVVVRQRLGNPKIDDFDCRLLILQIRQNV